MATSVIYTTLEHDATLIARSGVVMNKTSLNDKSIDYTIIAAVVCLDNLINDNTF